LDEISFKKMCFVHFWTVNAWQYTYLRGKPLPYQRGRNFIDGHCIIISNYFIFLVMFYEPRTRVPMVVEKLWIIYCMYINFIQSSSFNCWIKFNFDSK
jgi:hypothetical protein